MHHFTYKTKTLHAEGVNLNAIADAVGTPFYCYSEATLRRHIRVFQNAFKGANALTAYSVKANSNLAVLRILAEEGAGADIVSSGELKRARLAGILGEKIVFSGVGKTREEMAAALDENIHQFNLESEPELEALNGVALSKGVRAPIAFRVNPDVAAGGHEKISTGKAEDKFGVAWTQARALYAKARMMRGIDVKGIDVHIGSQISDLAPFEKAFTRVAELVQELRADGAAIERVDLGGGLGIPYGDNAADPPHPDEYAGLIRRIADPLGVQLIFEPGRMVVGNAGIMVAKVIYDKAGDARRFLILDAGMNDLIRPALYDAWHRIIAVREPEPGETKIKYDIVGPVCETGDRFALERDLPQQSPGDLVAFMSAGAYGAVQASQYNSRPLIQEILVNGDQFAVIRKRPSFEEMTALEKTPDWLA